jgi:hypothetical protein
MLFGKKMTQNACFFPPAKVIENNKKAVKMSQNRAKAWAIVHAF